MYTVAAPYNETEMTMPPNIEIFYQDMADTKWGNLDSYFSGAGWYYWFCQPGCLPDSDPIGPFVTEADAIADAEQIED